MKVLDLLCVHDHGFEGWFASEDDFQGQLARGLVQCPLCASGEIRKALSAPRLNLRGGSARACPGVEAASRLQGGGGTSLPPSSPMPRELQAAWLHLARRIVQQTEDVGARFAEEARRMHHGETEERGIRGRATVREAEQLIEEGIAVLPMPMPAAAEEPLH